LASLTCTFTLIPYLVNWQRRMVFPAILSFYAILRKLFYTHAHTHHTHTHTHLHLLTLFAAACLLGFTYVCTLMNGYSETHCETPYRAAGPYHASCVAQGIHHSCHCSA
jgi:hypothetical protein